MNTFIDILHNGNYSCVICKGDEIHTFTQRGVADLYDLIKTNPDLLYAASVADKVIGKAAASLMIIGNVKEIYADIISQAAIDILSDTNIKLSYKEKIPFIQNRDQSGWCPLEKMTKEEESLDNIFTLIENFILSMRNK